MVYISSVNATFVNYAAKAGPAAHRKVKTEDIAYGNLYVMWSTRPIHPERMERAVPLRNWGHRVKACASDVPKHSITTLVEYSEIGPIIREEK